MMVRLWLSLWWLLLVIGVRINCDEKITTTQVMIMMCGDDAGVDDSGVKPHTLPFWQRGDKPDMELVQNFTPSDFQAKNFTPSISPNFNSFSKKKHKK